MRVSKNLYLTLIIGGFAVAGALFVLAIMAIVGAAASTNGQVDSPAANAAMAGAGGLIMFAIMCLWIPGITFLVLLYKAWSAINDGQNRTTPGAAVGLLFIPLFNIYWMFQAIWGWAQDYNKYLVRHNQRAEQMPEGLFLVFTICYLFFFPAAFVMFFMIVPKMCDGINALGAAQPAAMGATAGR